MFDNDIWEFIGIASGAVMGMIVLCVLIIFSFQFYIVRFVENVPVKCWVDKKLVYEGISAGVEIDSGGITTTVKINGGFLYFFPQKYYVSNDVKLEGIK